MRKIIEFSLKRIYREGLTSLAVPMLAFSLVLLLSVLGGVYAQMEAEYEDMMTNHEITVEVSDSDGTATSGLKIGELYLSQLTDPDAVFSMHGYIKNLVLKRELDIVGENAQTSSVMLIGLDDESKIGYFADAYSLVNAVIISYDPAVEIDYFEGFDAGIFESDYTNSSSGYCVISEDLMEFVNDGLLEFSTIYRMGPNTRIKDFWLKVAGTVSNAADGEFDSVAFTSVRNLNYIAQTTKNEVLETSAFIYNDQRITFYSYEITITLDLPVVGSLVGITAVEAFGATSTDGDAEVCFFDGYDESVLQSNAYVCLVSEDILESVHEGTLDVFVRSKENAIANPVEVGMEVVGTVSGAGERLVFAPFWTVSELGVESDGLPPHTELVRATISDNSMLSAFKQTAYRTFKEVGVFFNPKVFSMTVFDYEFYNKTETIMQTIFFINIVSPVIYVLTSGLGFIASSVTTRRRKDEFAIMRSIGVGRGGIFLGAVLEQAVLCSVGVIIGTAVFSLTWDYVFIERSLIFFGCYMFGTVFSAARAAGTDVLRLLREKE